MGGGDLNMKKSWHPLLIKNQERVWKEEQKAAEEGKKLAQLKKELEEERYLQELKKLQEGKGGNERLEWMYASAASHSNSAKAQETEDFLLGKKRVDSLVEQGTSLSRLSADSKDIFMDTMNPNANSYKDIQSKIRDDPLFHIKKIEQAHIKAIVNNPLKLKRLQEKTKKKDKDKKKDRRDKRHKKIDKEERKNKLSDNNKKYY